jgi:ABC-type branched-subunit amino acid transport system substrate-binding protein
MAAIDVQLKREASEQTPEFKEFLSGIKSLGGTLNFGSPTSVAYDGLKMFAAAAEKANSTDAEKMVEAINDITWKPGDFVSYGKAALDLSADSVFPVIRTARSPSCRWRR